MVIFHCYVSSPEGILHLWLEDQTTQSSRLGMLSLGHQDFANQLVIEKSADFTKWPWDNVNMEKHGDVNIVNIVNMGNDIVNMGNDIVNMGNDAVTGWWYAYPSEKYESQLESLFPIYGKNMFQTTNQVTMIITGLIWRTIYRKPDGFFQPSGVPTDVPFI